MGDLRVYFLAVGQGDCTYIELPNGQTMLVDINLHPDHGVDVIRFLKDRIPETKDMDGNPIRKLNYLVITHAHEDHIKGINELDDEFMFGEIWDSGHEYDYGEELWNEYREIVKKYDAKKLVKRLKASSESFTIGDGDQMVTFQILSPSSYVKPDGDMTEEEKREAIHAECMVVRLSFQNFGIILTGDSNKTCWERIVKNYQDILPSKLLHATHHGSRTFFKNDKDDMEPLQEHLRKINPEYLVISVSYPSKHEHPHDDAMTLYKQVVPEKGIYFTETKDSRACHILRIYKQPSNGKWYYSLTSSPEMAEQYLLTEDKEEELTSFKSFVKIEAKIGTSKHGNFLENYPNNSRRLPKGMWIRFRRINCNVSEPFSVRWEVRNHGHEASADNGLYHDSGIQSSGDSDFVTRYETTKYKGRHFMDCVILKNGKELCKTRHIVNIR
jgi:competence protein ComEC